MNIIITAMSPTAFCPRGGDSLWVKGGVFLPLDPGGVVSASGSSGVYPLCTHNPLVIHSLGRHPTDRHPLPGPRGPRGRHPLGRHTLPKADTPPLGRHPPGRSLPQDGHCCGRYATYWNAFLLIPILFLSTV